MNLIPSTNGQCRVRRHARAKAAAYETLVMGHGMRVNHLLELGSGVAHSLVDVHGLYYWLLGVGPLTVIC